MSDQIAFLCARLDEDEHYLRVMTKVGQRKADEATPQDEADAYGLAISILSDPEAAAILEQWCDGHVLPPNHNDRLLAEIAAKRKILDEYDRLDADPARLTDAAMHLCWTVLGNVVRVQSAVYSTHPDYRQEWAA